MITWCATGHRPGKLGGYAPGARAELEDFATWYFRQHRPDQFISGMAQGWDQACAVACCDLGIPWEAAVPFAGQGSKWPQEAQMRYRALLARADKVTVVGVSYSPRVMQDRNEYMARHSDGVIALWDGSKQQGVPIINLWD